MRFHSEFETPKKLERKLINSGFSKAQMHGAMLAFLIIPYRISKPLGKICAKILEPIDPVFSDIPVLRGFTNYLIAIAKK